ncbi:MAG: C39 family peptidase [Clostridium sp.]|nr:C39 family peptidase [Clostridium sp.]MDU7085485.1 C39 family peptidase [Clostridium sp.]
MLKLKKKTLYDKKKSFKRMILCGTVLGMFTISAFSMGMSQGSNTLGKKAVGINETQKINSNEDEEVKHEVRSVVDNVPNSGKQKISKRKGIIDVPYIDQTNYYPSGCEVVSATMLLQYYGYEIFVDQYVDKYLDTSTIESKDGILIAEDPNEYFIGDPRSSYSYGCFAPVIVKSMNKILDGGKKAENITGTSLEEITEKYIEKGIPVLVWATIEMEPPSEGTDWLLKSNGLRYHWIGGEHCLVLVGYDDTSYYFNDPYNNNGLVAYKKEVVEQRYEDLGKQAVVVVN